MNVENVDGGSQVPDSKGDDIITKSGNSWAATEWGQLNRRQAAALIGRWW